MNADQATSLRELFIDMVPENMGLLKGRVISASPLKIQALNDEKLTLSSGSLCVPQHLKAYKTTIDIPELGVQNTEITIDCALKNGDIVDMLSFNQQKKYYVLGKE